MPQWTKPKMLTDAPLTFCPGCTHGIATKIVAEVLDELNLQNKVVEVASVGCSVFSYNFFNADSQQAAHGRAPAVATGIKRVHPDKVVFTYQGDGDLASIGLAEIVHAGLRGEKITVIFINNAIYGMTGGQMAPTTLIGQKTSTSPYGRDVKKQGNPIHVCELLATQDGPAYLERVMMCDYANVIKAKRAIKKAFEYQIAGKGFTLVEVLATCPTNWSMNPSDAMAHVKNEMTKVYPLGVFKDIGGDK